MCVFLYFVKSLDQFQAHFGVLFELILVTCNVDKIADALKRINREKTAQTVRDLPAFKRGATPSDEEWKKFNLKDEYAKMGVPNAEWKLTDLNENFGLCDTHQPMAGAALMVRNSTFEFLSRERLKKAQM